MLIASVVTAGTPQKRTSVPVSWPVGSTDYLRNVSAVFLSDDLVCLLQRTGKYPDAITQIRVLRLTGEGLTLASSISKPFEGDQVYTISGGRILLKTRQTVVIFSSDLKRVGELPLRVLVAPFPLSDVFGEYGSDGWKVFLAEPGFQLIARGSGDLRALSGHAFVVSHAGVIRTQGRDGRPIGSIPFAPEGDVVEMASADSVFLNERKEERGGLCLWRAGNRAGSTLLMAGDLATAGVGMASELFSTNLPARYLCISGLAKSWLLF